MITPDLFSPNPPPGTVPVTISGASLRQRFAPCGPDYIRSVCHGRCCVIGGLCRGRGNGILVVVHPTERESVRAAGGTLTPDGNWLRSNDLGLCPFWGPDGLCTAHGVAQPFACRYSPFTLNANGTLMIKNRSRMLRCYGRRAGEVAIPAYQAHRWSLGQIFGEEEADRIAARAAAGTGLFTGYMPAEKHEMFTSARRLYSSVYQARKDGTRSADGN